MFFQGLLIRRLIPPNARSAAFSMHASIGVPLPSSKLIYLDYNGTTPVYPEVKEAMLPYLSEQFGNASSGHTLGLDARRGVERARGQVAAMIGSGPDEVAFTSCGTESDNWAIWGAVAAARARSIKGEQPSSLPHVVTSSIEHPAILNQLKHLESLSLLKYTVVPVSNEGLVDVDDVVEALRPDATCLVSIMHSNNETGAIQPISRIVKAVKSQMHQVLVHTDAAQSFGKGINVNVRELGVDLATLVGHKMGAPKGCAALYVKRGVKIAPLFVGGGQESGLRSGTESPLVIALGAASELAQEREELLGHLRKLRDTLERSLLESFPEGEARVNGPKDRDLRLPNTLSIGIKGLKSSVLLSNLRKKLAASAGASCHSNDGTVSSVLQAMNVPSEYAIGTLRLSVGRHSTLGDVTSAIDLILEECERQGITLLKKKHSGTPATSKEKSQAEIEWERNLF
jgi:cysteine desulfurase